MSNRIGRVHKFGKHNRKRPFTNNNPLTVPVSISKRHNTNDKNIDMTLNSSFTNTTLSTNTADVHEKPPDTIDQEIANNSKNDQN